MPPSQTKSYSIFIDNTSASRAVKALEKDAAALEKKIEEIKVAGGDATREMQKLANVRTQIDALKKSIDSGLNRSLRDMEKELKGLQNSLKRATDPATITQLNAQIDIAKRNILEYRANVLKAADAQKQLAAENGGFFTRMFGGAKDAFVGAFGGNLLADGVVRLIEGLKAAGADAIRLGREAVGVRRAFNRLNDPDLLKELRNATRGTVSDLELMKKAVTSNSFQLPLENLGTLLQFAARRAKDTGENVNFLVNSIVTGIARKSSPILDNLGITASRIADEFAKTGDYAKAVTTIVQEELSKMGNALDDADQKAERWATRWENIKERVGGWTLAVGDFFANLAQFQVGDAESKAEAAIAMAQNEISAQKERARAEELAALDLFNNEYKKSTAEAQAQLLTLAKESIDAITAQEAAALKRGDFELLGRLNVRKEIWNNYFKGLEDSSKSNITTLGSLKSELAILQGQMDNLPVGSEQLDKTVKDIARLQKQINAAMGQEDPEAKKNQQKLEQEAKRLKDFLKKNADELTLANLDAAEKEIKAVEFKYAEFERLARGNAEVEKLLAEQKAAEIANINKRVANDIAKQFKEQQAQIYLLRQQKDEASRQERLGILERSRNSARALAGFAERSVQGLDNASLINAELKARKAGFFQQLAAEKQYLTEKERLEQKSLRSALESGQITHAEFLAQQAATEQNFREQRFEAEISFYANLTNVIASFASSAISVFETINQAKKASEDAELERDKRNNIKLRENLKRQLDGKLISREQFDQRIASLDKQMEEKEKALKLRQFKRDKQANIIKAIIGTAQAVVQALTAGPIVGAILAAAYGALGAIQIATISRQQPPEYGDGGKLNGPSHDSKHKGMPVTDPRTGRVQAYLEGDEGIVNKRAMSSKKQYTVSGTPSAIASAINALYGGVNWDSSAVISASRKSYQPRVASMPALTQTITRSKIYADGGVMTTTAGDAPLPQPPAPTMDATVLAVLQGNTAAIQQLNAQLAAGIKAYTVLSEHNSQQLRLQQIQTDATMRP